MRFLRFAAAVAVAAMRPSRGRGARLVGLACAAKGSCRSRPGNGTTPSPSKTKIDVSDLIEKVAGRRKNDGAPRPDSRAALRGRPSVWTVEIVGGLVEQ